MEGAGEALGKHVVRVRRLAGHEGGYSEVIRRVIELADGRSAFIKFGETPQLRESLRREIAMYDDLDEPFMLTKLGQVDSDEGVALILENQEGALWPPPWTEPRIEAVVEALEQLRDTLWPERLVWDGGPASLVSQPTGWVYIADKPETFLALGMVSKSWLTNNIDALVQEARIDDLQGETLAHLDVRSDNICFVDGQVRLIDWSGARLGHRYVDQHYWVSTLHRETGVRRSDLLGADAASHLGFLAGHYARVAAKSVELTEPSARIQRAADSLHALLPWACELLGLEPPDGATPTRRQDRCR